MVLCNKRAIKLAVIGMGMIGKLHAQKIKHIKECELVAICDTNISVRGAAHKLGAKYYNNYIDMIEEEKLDGVIIALPNELHETVSINCANKGIHIMVEKPISTSIDSAKNIINSCRENNVKLLVAHHRRFNSKIIALKNLIQNREIGDVVGISVLWCMYKPDEYFIDGYWRRKKGSGGVILINTIHEIDNLRYIYGEIDRVYAEISNKTRKFEVEDTVSISLRFKDGVLASILMSDTAPSIWGYECTMGENPFFYSTKGTIYIFLGTKASITVPGMNKIYYPNNGKKGWQYPLKIEKLKIKHQDPYIEQIKHFCSVIAGKVEPITSGEDALKTLEVTMAIIESGKRNEPISIKSGV